MTLSESLLSSWAAPPGDSKAQEAYRQIQVALNNNSEIKLVTVEKYLQGSYRNRTHIRADSDVDVVAELQSSFYYNIDDLTQYEKALFKERYPSSATYTFDNFRQDVGKALIDYFGVGNVTEGNKCFNIKGNNQRSNADVLACLEHRKYIRFLMEGENYIPGIKFFTKREHDLIINWPKVHYKNGATKNQNTNDMFKGLVRIEKHIRNWLIENNHIRENLAPSYFLECLMYNVPDRYFSKTYVDSLAAALLFLQNATLSNFRCVNEQDFLFAPGNGWNEPDARTFIEFMIGVNR